MSTLKEDVAELRTEVKDLRKSVVGDPATPEFRGIYQRLDDLERVWSNISRATWIAAGAAIEQRLGELEAWQQRIRQA